jgi:hypothetical protein
MPYPILLAVGAALSAAGAGAEVVGTQKSQSAMNSAVESELAQQQGYAKQGRSIFEQSLQKSSPATAQSEMAQGQQKAMSDYQRLQSLDLNSAGKQAPFQSDSSALTIDQGRTNLSNVEQAKLQGYSEWDLQQQIKDLQAKGQLGVLSTNAANTASLLPYQLQAAQHAGDSWTGIGSLLSAAGGVAGSLGALAPAAAGTAAASGGTSLINDAPSFGGSFLKVIPILPAVTSPFV